MDQSLLTPFLIGTFNCQLPCAPVKMNPDQSKEGDSSELAQKLRIIRQHPTSSGLPKITKSQSHRIVRENKCGQTVPEVHESMGGLPIPPQPKNSYANRFPTPVPPKLLRGNLHRAVTIKAHQKVSRTDSQSSMSNHETFTVPTVLQESDKSEKKETNVCTFENLRFRMRSNILLQISPAFVDFKGLVAHYEDRIRQNIQDFPSVRITQTRGPSHTPTWSWMAQLQKISREVDANKTKLFSEQDARAISEKFYQYSELVLKTKLVLGEVRLDFENGVVGFDECSVEENIKKLAVEFNVCRASERGNSILNLGMIPYVKSIFQNEKKKQDRYHHWMNRVKIGKETMRRNDAVKWVIKTAARLNYAAETAHLAVHIIDAYWTIKANVIADNEWVLLAIGALLIAGKMEEKAATDVKRLILLSNHFYRPEDVCCMERKILLKLKFDVNPPLAPLFAQMVILCGSLDLNSNIRKLVLDLSLSILYRALLFPNLFKVPPLDKAKAAVEIAVEFVHFQFNIYKMKDLGKYSFVSAQPGKEVGDFASDLCVDLLQQRFRTEKFHSAVKKTDLPFTASPVRKVNA